MFIARRRFMARTRNAANAVDVVIVGSGFAGLAAAIESGEKASSVLILEKMREFGGNSIMNAGQVAAVHTQHQQKAGIDDSPELMIGDMLRAGRNLNHRHLLEKLVAESNATAEWLTESLGVEFRERLTHMGGHSVPRTLCTLNTTGRDIIDPMLRKIAAMPNVELRADSPVDALVISPEGRVAGVRLASGGIIPARRGVVMAAGGFGADVAFRKIHRPEYDENVMSTNHAGATSETLRSVLKLGASAVHLHEIQLGPWTSPDEAGFGRVPMFCIGAGFPYGVLVDPETGTRFVNEMGNRDERSQAILGRGHPAVLVADAVGAQHSLDKDLASLAPAVRAFDNLDALADAYNMDITMLRDTIDEYNRGVAKRDDRFGKALRDDVAPIAQAPFYASRVWPKVHHSCGGVHINTEAQVMHVDGFAIPGLYAAGEFVGGIHGADRLGSCATTDCLVFGRVAGRNAAAESLLKLDDCFGRRYHEHAA
ncbi:hypothetical protein CTAYLR_007130 [Chrysophaeum taylorii]|uniref:FAD-dependent oxidoreductase 2 FAD-binding domain-containing protein n=1 Tax=Chrysophaeum taylorii TaxID=2483200 RepID=A0AAD7U817_9STRA|nr:hypothetical protein CTAYLR_007130 [Chrysophaeum taylorii]